MFNFWGDEHRLIMRSDGTSFGLPEEVLAALIAARPAPAGEAAEVERLREQVADFAEAMARTNRAVLAISGQRDAAEAALAQARAVLRRVEWCKGIQTDQDFAHRDACPVCRGWSAERYDDGKGHTPGCALAAEIGPRPDADQSESFPPERMLSESPISGVAELAPARVQVRTPINGDHHVLDTDRGRTVETRRNGPAHGVPVVERDDGGRDGT